MLDYQKRVVEEKKELDEKIDKLIHFIELGSFEKIDADEQSRLRVQGRIMQAYSACLRERIAHFK